MSDVSLGTAGAGQLIWDVDLRESGAELELTQADLRAEDLANFAMMQAKDWPGADLQLDDLQTEIITSAGTKRTQRKRALELLQRVRRFSKRTREKVGTVTAQLRRRPTRAELLNAESRLGSTMFGPIPEGHRREFFHDQKNIWIWHEGWSDGDEEHEMTVRYEIRPSGVYKKLSAGYYVQLKDDELENFRLATHVYLFLIKQKLYRNI